MSSETLPAEEILNSFNFLINFKQRFAPNVGQFENIVYEKIYILIDCNYLSLFLQKGQIESVYGN